MIKILFCISFITGFIECQMQDRIYLSPPYKEFENRDDINNNQAPFLIESVNTNQQEHKKLKDYIIIEGKEKRNSELFVPNTQTETGDVQSEVGSEIGNQFAPTKYGKDVFLVLVECMNNQNKGSKTRRRFSPINPVMFNSNNIKNALGKLNQQLEINSTATTRTKELPTYVGDKEAVSNNQIGNNFVTKSYTHNQTSEEDTNVTDNVEQSDIVKNENDEIADIFDDKRLWSQNRRMNNEDIEKVLTNPTSGIVVRPLTRPNIMLIQNSRVCYACSTVGNKNCWSPDRSTTVKYCRKGNDACITKRIDKESTILIRDCGNSCDENDLPGLNQEYTSCSICHYDLCNSAFTNSINIFAVSIVSLSTIFTKYI